MWCKVVFGVLAVISVAGVSWWYLARPETGTHMLPETASVDLSAYDGSAPADAGSPSVLTLGSSHFAQEDYGFAQQEFDEVVEALAQFDPDMVMVEYPPPDWPPGEGRDYRPEFDLGFYAESWGMSLDDAAAIVERYRQDGHGDDAPCQLGQAYFLQRDLANALYQWHGRDCSEVWRHEEIREWLEYMAESEHARIAVPVARRSGVPELVSMDYQGEDAAWFIYDEGLELLQSGRLRTLIDFWPVLPVVGTTARAWQSHQRGHQDSLEALLQRLNSPAHIAMQYWVYEIVYPRVDYQEIGQRQTDAYWLRNERMFDMMQASIEAQDPERVLVVVGAGHRYFLDELVYEQGYRWIDPREWLPSVE